MSRITGKEPGHWHRTDADGVEHHHMNDPRRLDIPRSFWSADERAYVTHLEQHEAQGIDPAPREDDAPLVQAVLAWITAREQELHTLRKLTIATREELAGGVAPRDSKGVAALGVAIRAFLDRPAPGDDTPTDREPDTAGQDDPTPTTTTTEERI